MFQQCVAGIVVDLAVDTAVREVAVLNAKHSLVATEVAAWCISEGCRQRTEGAAERIQCWWRRKAATRRRRRVGVEALDEKGTLSASLFSPGADAAASGRFTGHTNAVSQPTISLPFAESGRSRPVSLPLVRRVTAAEKISAWRKRRHRAPPAESPQRKRQSSIRLAILCLGRRPP